MEQITLFYRQGTSDKVYQAAIQQQGNRYSVVFSYGRRGSTLSTGTKTPTAVDYDAAKAIYDKLVNEKLAKGYTPGESGTPYAHTEKENQATGIHCQLLNPIDADEAAALISDADWCMQEKHNGKRLLIRKDLNGETTGINRKGLIVSLPSSLMEAAQKIERAFLLDGEAVGEQFVAFDLLEIGGADIRQWSYRKRLFAVGHLLEGADPRLLRAVHSGSGTQEKLTLFEQLKHHHKEGVAFKRLSSVYTPGRPASGGDQLKFKFVETATFIVSRINTKRSVNLLLFEGDKVRQAGNVTIPGSHSIPAVGAVVEVRYLYAFHESGHIYQPVYLGVRDDIAPEECTVSQLKYKAEPQETEKAA